MSNDLHKVMKYAHNLSKNKKIIDLVRIMDPLDVAKVFQNNLDIKPKEAAYLFAHFVKESGLVEWAQAGGGSGPFPVPNKKSTPIDEDYMDMAPAHDIDPNQFPPPPQANSGNDFPYDPETVLTMRPTSKHKRALETLGDGEPSDNPDLNPGVSGNGTFQKTQGAQNKSGVMSTTGGSLTSLGGVPGLSNTPDGKEYDKDQAQVRPSTPIQVGEDLDDPDMMHTTQDDSGEGGLSKQVPIPFGGSNAGRRMGRI